MKNEELIKASKATFEAHPKEEVVIATTDGQFFLEKGKSHAFNHANSTGCEVIEITKEEAFGNFAKAEEIDPEDFDLNKLKVDELKDFAKLNGIEITAKVKTEIVKEIEEGLMQLELEDLDTDRRSKETNSTSEEE